ncbi:amino acid dehydrogenase [Burkholderia pyrrocinia]|uniref:Amino acid dehydrogenase n=1 Tax=Burkholderia pyrrocinia TaxID=60550 RepID=A0A2Z5N0V5_BURPY|nr:D-amino acid dehydrogenase [Burkholderia pyrrocinia]AXF22407.1 amino acid dehydrogenase [Burkholderia pyrrocinia]
MNVVVVGAGVVGVTTAYFLQDNGCQVTVVDRQADPAMECSHANGGFLSAGLSAPWSAPGAVGMAFRSLFDRSAPFKWRPDFSLRQIAWMMRSLKACRPDRFAVNRARLTRLAMYSHVCRHDIESAVGIDYRRSQDGVLQIYREPVPRTLVDGHVGYLHAMGITGAFLSPEQVFAMEPALAQSSPGLFGALHLPGDQSGDCRRFTGALAAVVQRQGGTFLWNTPVDRIEIEASGRSGTRIKQLISHDVELSADAVVIAAGCDTSMLLDRIVPMPVYPVKGYSMTATLLDPERAPRHSMFDFSCKTGIARLGDQIRVSGIAEVVGNDHRIDPARCRQLASTFEAIFPKAADLGAPAFWTGFRPTLPDGVPFVCPTPLANLFVNAGHGGSGWSTACGAGKLMADIVVGNRPELDAMDYALRRPD